MTRENQVSPTPTESDMTATGSHKIVASDQNIYRKDADLDVMTHEEGNENPKSDLHVEKTCV
jgi:hypothetical protein